MLSNTERLILFYSRLSTWDYKYDYDVNKYIKQLIKRELLFV